MKITTAVLMVAFSIYAQVYGESDLPEPITIQLQKVRGTTTVTKELLLSNLALSKKTGGTAIVPQINIGSEIYVGQFSVGTPPQKVYGLFDTGSSSVWVGSSSVCRQNKTFCEKHETYDHSKSKTYKDLNKNFSINYVTGYTRGKLIQDNLQIGKLKLKGLVFGEATEFDSSIDRDHYDSIFGLKFASDHAEGFSDVEPPFLRMIREKVVGKGIFAFYLSRPGSKDFSEITLGGVNPKRYTNDFVFSPVVYERYWGIQIDKLIICKQEVLPAFPTVVDTGANVFAGPTASIAAINNALGVKEGVREDNITNYYVDCDSVKKLPILTFVINGKPLPVPAEYFVIKDEDSDNLCITGFVGYDFLHGFIMGEGFIRKYYVQFDMEQLRIGFAPAT